MFGVTGGVDDVVLRNKQTWEKQRTGAHSHRLCTGPPHIMAFSILFYMCLFSAITSRKKIFIFLFSEESPSWWRNFWCTHIESACRTGGRNGQRCKFAAKFIGMTINKMLFSGTHRNRYVRRWWRRWWRCDHNVISYTSECLKFMDCRNYLLHWIERNWSWQFIPEL